MKAFLQSTCDPSDWVNIQASIQQGQMRLDWKGPQARASLLYDRDSSRITFMDPIHKTLFSLPSEDQTTLKLALVLFAAELKKKADGANPETRHALDLAAKNAQAFFNGVPQLEKKSVQVGGFSCDKWVTSGKTGGKMREVWITPYPGTGMAVEDYNTLRSLAHLALDLASPLLNQWEVDSGIFEQNFYGSDFPVEEALYVKGKSSARFKVLGIQTRTFGLETFQLPSGYQTLGLLDLLKQGSDN